MISSARYSGMLALAVVLCSGCAKDTYDAPESVADANFKLGIGYMQSGRREVAAEKLQKAVQFKEDFPEAHNALGVLYEDLREWHAAEKHFKRAIELKSDYALAKINYARFLCTRLSERATEGEALFTQIAETPEHAGAVAGSAYTGLAACARQRNDMAQVEVWLRKAVEVDPAQAYALLELADLYRRNGQTLQARAFLQRYHAQTKPSPQSLNLGLTIEQAKDGDPQLRREYAAVLLSQFPQSEEARRLSSPP